MPILIISAREIAWYVWKTLSANQQDHTENFQIKRLNYQYFLSLSCYLSFRITVVKVSRLLLIWLPSLNLVPSAFVWEARSLPARSTRYCKEKEFEVRYMQRYTPKKVPNQGKEMHTRLAKKDLKDPVLSRRLLSIVWIWKSIGLDITTMTDTQSNFI